MNNDNLSKNRLDPGQPPFNSLRRMRIIKLNFFSGSGVVPVNCNVIVFSPRFAIFKNVVHTCSLEPGETPSNSASHQVQTIAQRS